MDSGYRITPRTRSQRMLTETIAIATEFTTEQQCLEFLEQMRWPGGVRCIGCSSDRICKFQVKETTRKIKRANGRTQMVAVPARQLYECLSCRRQFAATTGTLFHDTHLPLLKWFFAIALLIRNKDLSTHQMRRELGVSYKTAWFLCHRIREGIESQAHAAGDVLEPDTAQLNLGWSPPLLILPQK